MPQPMSMDAAIQVSSRGTMALPKPLRKVLGVDKGGVVMASAEKDGIVLHPAVTFPIELYSDVRVAEFDAADKELAGHVSRKRVPKSAVGLA